MSDATIQGFQERMDRLDRPSFGNVLELERTFGLRAEEAIRCGNTGTLARWQRELEQQGRIRVIEGTKGGHPRWVHPADLDRARTAIERARATLAASGQRYLIALADGSKPKGLQQAVSVYRNVLYRAHIQGHGARYAFTRERVHTYRNEGLSKREALSATSLDLGHGDGRGRYIASVYARDR